MNNNSQQPPVTNTPEHCPSDVEGKLMTACEEKLAAQAAYDEAILGVLVVQRDCSGRPRACDEASEQLLGRTRARLDTAINIYRSVEEQMLYTSLAT